jgi:hypothetical protein
MKRSFCLFAIVVCLVLIGLGNHVAFAQTADSTSSDPLASLTPAEKQQLLKVRQQVISSNPDLETERDAIRKQKQALKDGTATPQQKIALLKEIQAHQEKMKAAMLKIDPTLGPVIDKVNASVKQEFQQSAAGK